MDGQKAIGIRITEKPVTASCTMTFQMHQVEAWTADPRAACRPHLPCMATPSVSGSISIAGVGKKSDFSSNGSFDRGRPPAPTHGGWLRRPSLVFSNLLVAGWSVRRNHSVPPRISETRRKHSEHCRDNPGASSPQFRYRDERSRPSVGGEATGRFILTKSHEWE